MLQLIVGELTKGKCEKRPCDSDTASAISASEFSGETQG